MKNINTTIHYEAPELSVQDICLESGFAASSQEWELLPPDFGDGGSF